MPFFPLIFSGVTFGGRRRFLRQFSNSFDFGPKEGKNRFSRNFCRFFFCVVPCQSIKVFFPPNHGAESAAAGTEKSCSTLLLRVGCWRNSISGGYRFLGQSDTWPHFAVMLGSTPIKALLDKNENIDL